MRDTVPSARFIRNCTAAVVREEYREFGELHPSIREPPLLFLPVE